MVGYSNANGVGGGGGLVPVGGMISFSASTPPEGFLVCNGSAVSRTVYAELFSVIGTSHGAGDGSTTFNVPNLINKVIWGSTTVGTEKEAGLPNIKGTFYGQRLAVWLYTSGCFYNAGGNNDGVESGASISPIGVGFDASTYNSIYKDDVQTVQPPAVTELPCIKY